MKRLEFHISYICPHKCIFCSEYDRMNKFKKYPLSTKEIKIILLDRRKKWFNHVNFTGWEPSIVPNFIDLLEFAKKLGYKIYMWTNGTMLYSDVFAEKSLKYIDELSLSVHWYDEDTCYKQVGVKNHFNNYSKIVQNVMKYTNNSELFLNIVINKYNYKDVLKIIKFNIDLWYDFDQVLVSNIAPEWKAEHDFEKISFNLDELKQYIPDIVDFCNKNNKRLRFFWIPNCVLSEKYEEYSNDLHWEGRHTIERFETKAWKVALIDVNSIDNSRKRAFVEKCNTCKWKRKPCMWFFKKYADLYEV